MSVGTCLPAMFPGATWPAGFPKDGSVRPVLAFSSAQSGQDK